MKKLSTPAMKNRDSKIKKMYKTGRYSIRALAKKIGLSKTRVCEIILE